MDKVEKFLRKLTKTDLHAIEQTIVLLQTNKLEKLDIKKLKGYVDVYRVRVGRLRIIYRRVAFVIIVLDISYRNEKTYKDFS